VRAQVRVSQQPRQRVFSLASNFEFSTASTSTYCAFWSVRVLDAAGLSSAAVALDVARLGGVGVGAVELL